MMIKSGFLDDDMCMVTDYGTNAEMAIKVGDRVLTGSAAAGPAIEGQQISAGMLASPGAISDLTAIPEGWQTMVLNKELEPCAGAKLSLRGNTLKLHGRRAQGITGTGVIAVVFAGLEAERIVLPCIVGGGISLDRNIKFTTADLLEAGKAIGAIRAGHMTLLEEAGMDPGDLGTMYMAGASGTYVDARKAQAVGMVPASAKRLVQIGNTSLELAKDLALDPEILDRLNSMTKELLAHHIMFASSPTFSDIYLQELAYWTEGMPREAYERNLSNLGIRTVTPPVEGVAVERRVLTDIWDVGEGLTMIDPGVFLSGTWSCDLCLRCMQACPEKALRYAEGRFLVDTGRCLGTACRRCEETCPQKVFSYAGLSLEGPSDDQ
jgi:methylamine methyltransferase corrinoid protein reductive activase